jgi:hypothetical protein
MAVLDSLAAKLVSAGVGTLATDIFLARMPDSPNACVTLYENQGVGPDHVFGASVKAIDHQRIRAYCRAERNDYPTARTKAEQVRAALGAIRGETISGLTVLCVLSTSELYPLARDGDDRAIIGCDFTVWLP